MLQSISGGITQLKPRKPPKYKKYPSHQRIDEIIRNISLETLSHTILSPIDQARESFFLPHVTAENPSESLDIASSYFTHLNRSIGKIIPPDQQETANAEALTLLEKASQPHGGLKAILAECRDGNQGRIHWMLDIMTQRFKEEAMQTRVSYVLNTTLATLNWDEKMQVMDALLKRLAPHLPPDIDIHTPERYAENLETIIQLYVQSFDRFVRYIKKF